MKLIPNHNGFTLLEVLVVMVIIAVMVGMVTLATGSNPARDLDREARRLQAVMSLAAEEAVMQGREIGLALSATESAGTTYQFLYLNPETESWDVVEDNALAAYDLPDDIDLDIEIDGQSADRQVLDQIRRMQSIQSNASQRPLVLMLSSGEVTPFILTLTHLRTNLSMQLATDGFSEMVLQ